MYLYEDIPEAERHALLDKLAGEVVRFHMATPAIIFLESTKYMNRIGSQFLIFLSPVVTAIFTKWELEKYAVIIEERENIEYLLDKIEELDRQQQDKEKEWKAKRKEEKLRRKQRKKELKKEISGK
jgi:hypothetical protein